MHDDARLQFGHVPIRSGDAKRSLAKKFKGKPEYVENFMLFIAQELREIMARLGVRSLEEMCGRSDLLKIKEKLPASRAGVLDMSRILRRENYAEENSSDAQSETHFNPQDVFDFKLDSTLDEKILLPEFEKIVKKHKDFSDKKINLPSSPIKIQSTDRTFGTILGSEIQKRFGGEICENAFTVNVKGGAGQSFGAFIPKGLTLKLEGDANDYLGKGLSGGKIVVRMPSEAEYKSDENIIIGNVALFGATGGQAFINGKAGERFCVRNSGATAVVEGCGDHALEYMTGGTVVILGETGKNVAAGMSGGIAYILDASHELYKKLNSQLVLMEEISDEHDESNLRALIQQHAEETASQVAKNILENWKDFIPHFKKIIPSDYKKMLGEISKAQERGLNRADAELEAFKKMTA